MNIQLMKHHRKKPRKSAILNLFPLQKMNVQKLNVQVTVQMTIQLSFQKLNTPL